MYVLISGTFILASANFASAQDGSYALNTKTTLNFSPGNGSTVIKASEVSTNVLNDFSKKYKSVSELSWMTDGNSTWAYFNKNNIKMRSSYDVNGKWEYTMSYLPEAKMPADLRNQVRDEYNYMNITQVIEIQRKNDNVYFVKMEDKQSITTVICAGGETKVYEYVEKI